MDMLSAGPEAQTLLDSIPPEIFLRLSEYAMELRAFTSRNHLPESSPWCQAILGVVIKGATVHLPVATPLHQTATTTQTGSNENV